MIRKMSSLLRRREPRNEEFHRLLADYSLSGAFLVQDNLFRYVNRAFAEMFGYEAQDIMDRLSPTELTAPEDRDRVAMYLTRRMNGDLRDGSHTIRGIGKDGKRIYAVVRCTMIEHRNKPAIIGTVVDNTARIAAEEKLRFTSEEDISAYYVIDAEGIIRDCNEAFAHLFAFPSPKEAIGQNAEELYPMPRMREAFLQLIIEKKRVEHHDAVYVKRDGTRVYVVENAIGEFDSAGRLKSIRGYLLDETSRRTLEGQLYQSQRLENLGSLVGGIAHDFNNVLAIIAGHTSVLNKSRFDDSRFDASVEAVKKATKRGAHIVRQLLTFARKVELVTESVKIDDIVDEIVALCKETFQEKITFAVDIQSNLPSIHADPNQLHQVLLNICVNARDAMPNGGTLSITATRVGRASINAKFPDADAQEYIRLAISDTGTGMSDNTLRHIFEPFFTTKPLGQGTGLGLAVVYGIVKSHHGFIDVRSKVGRGTIFYLYLPVPLQSIEIHEPPAETTEAAKGTGETVLVVEDEAPLRDFVETTLKDNGYNVLLAADGVEGAEIYARHRGKIQLVLLDMGLPRMSGSELLSTLKRLDPGVRVIAASGYLEPEIKANIFEEGAVDFLPKPYMVPELLGKIGRAVNFQQH